MSEPDYGDWAKSIRDEPDHLRAAELAFAAPWVDGNNRPAFWQEGFIRAAMGMIEELRHHRS
jgi:hypothetical protein